MINSAYSNLVHSSTLAVKRQCPVGDNTMVKIFQTIFVIVSLSYNGSKNTDEGQNKARQAYMSLLFQVDSKQC